VALVAFDAEVGGTPVRRLSIGTSISPNALQLIRRIRAGTGGVLREESPAGAGR